MDLTSLSQKSTNLLATFVLTMFVCVATDASYSSANDPAATASNQSTLVILDSQPKPTISRASNSALPLNTLRPEALSSTGQQGTEKISNSLRNGLAVQPNLQNSLLLRPTQSTPTQLYTAALEPVDSNNSVPNATASNSLATSAPKLRQPNLVAQRIAQPIPVRLPIPQQQPQTAPLIQLVEHQEAVPEKTSTDPVADLLLSAHKLSQQATSENDYTAIADLCTKAIRQGADEERQGFASQLSSWALNRRGKLRSDDGQSDLAGADFQAALKYHPNNWRALHNRGVSYAQNGQFAEAFDDFNQVIQLHPQHAKAHVNRATLYFQINDLQSALEDYQQALERDPQLVTAQIGISRTYHLLGRWDDAIDHFGQAMELDPTNANIVCSRGDLLADMGRYRDALADYAHTIELKPEFAHAYRNGAWLLATCPDDEFRDAENAILGAQQALEFNYGKHHVALDTLAAALANAGQFREAVSTLHEAIEIAPSDAKAGYLSRLQLYQNHQPFRTQPAGELEQVVYEATDQ